MRLESTESSGHILPQLLPPKADGHPRGDETMEQSGDGEQVTQPQSGAEDTSQEGLGQPGPSASILERCLNLSPPDALVMVPSDNFGWDELRWAAVLSGKNRLEDSVVLSSKRQ